MGGPSAWARDFSRPLISITSASLNGVGTPSALPSRTTAPFRASISVCLPASICWSIDGLLNFFQHCSLIACLISGSCSVMPLAATTARISSMIRVWNSSTDGVREISPWRSPVIAATGLTELFSTHLSQI
jgi:hypothetical protein